MIAFFARNNATNADDPLDLMVVNPDGSGRRTVVDNAVSRGPCGYGLAWSPNGNKIAYISGGGLWVVDATGLHNHKIADLCGTAISWSPTGRWLALELSYAGYQRVGLVRPDGSGFRWLIDVAKGPLFDSHEFAPTFSPNGKTIAMTTAVIDVSNPWYGWGVFGVNVGDGRVVSRFADTNERPEGAIPGSLDWRRDGKAILADFHDIEAPACGVSGQGWENANLWTLSAGQDSTFKRVGSTTGEFQLREYDGVWSPTGMALTFVGYRARKCVNGAEVLAGSPSLYSMAANGTKVRKLYTAPGGVATVADPHWQTCGPRTKKCRTGRS